MKKYKNKYHKYPRMPLALIRNWKRTGDASLFVLLEALLRWRRRSVRLRQRHDAVRALQVRLEGSLIGGLQGMEEMLCLPRVVTMESPIAPKGEVQEQQQLKDSRKKKPLLSGLQISKRNLLSGNESGLWVGVVYAFFDGFRQNSHISGIVREHDQQSWNNHK